MSESKPSSATAIHGTSGDGKHLVGIGNLRVVITNDDGSWFAQGLEIDYAAQGSSIEDVQGRFGKGLYATIEEHLKLFGSIENLLHPAPHEIWVELLKCGRAFQRYTQVAIHEIAPEGAQLPFDAVEYLGVAA